VNRAGSAPRQPLLGELGQVLDAMPMPAGAANVDQLEAELAHQFGSRHAVAVSSGTAALHCALVALRIGPGDEVLVPAVSVVMSVAPILYVGARPVFADCDETGADFDYDDLAAKLTTRTRVVMPVYLWGRAADPERLMDFAARHGLRVIEDACQAHGTHARGRALGTVGDAGCFSLKDGKLIWCGEGGFILTDNQELAERCRAFRTHWQAPPAGQAPMAEIGHNYRLTEIQAVLARWNLSRFDDLLRRRQARTAALCSALADMPRLRWHQPRGWEDWNGFSPVATLNVPRPRELASRLAYTGVPNSVGSFALIANDQRPVFAHLHPLTCPRASHFIDSTLAVVLTEHDDEHDISAMADTITKEIGRWAL
jgi:perosamine synthetase